MSWRTKLKDMVDELIKPIPKIEGTSLAEDGIPPSIVLSSMEFGYLMFEIEKFIEAILAEERAEIKEGIGSLKEPLNSNGKFDIFRDWYNEALVDAINIVEDRETDAPNQTNRDSGDRTTARQE